MSGELNFAVANLWLDIMMKSEISSGFERYQQLADSTPVEIRLIMLAGTTKNLLLREILEMLGIPKSTLTSVINRLERKEYIKRVINPRDKRSFGLETTEKGDYFVKLYMDYQNEKGARILSGLNPDEQQQLFGLLQKIAANVIPNNDEEKQV